jgi:hypothetical protein
VYRKSRTRSRRSGEQRRAAENDACECTIAIANEALTQKGGRPVASFKVMLADCSVPDLVGSIDARINAKG